MRTKEALTPKKYNTWATYEFNVLQRTKIGGLCEENRVSSTVKKTFLTQNETGYIYQLDVLKREQSNIEGLRSMENDLSFLQQKILLQTNFEGEIVRIVNLHDNRALWKECYHAFYKKYKKEKGIECLIESIDKLVSDNVLFTETIKQSETATMLFPPIYQKHTLVNDCSQEQKTITDFFGDNGLPLQITTTLKKRDPFWDKAHVLRKGSLDKEKFEDEKVNKFFRKIADNYKLTTKITIKYIETYDLDEYHWITHSGQFFTANIPNLFSFEQIVRAIPIKRAL